MFWSDPRLSPWRQFHLLCRDKNTSAIARTCSPEGETQRSQIQRLNEPQKPVAVLVLDEV